MMVLKSSAEASLYRCGRNLAPPGSRYQSGPETEILLTAQRTMRRDPCTGAGCTGNLVTHASPHVSPPTRELRFSIGCPLAGFLPAWQTWKQGSFFLVINAHVAVDMALHARTIADIAC